MLKSIINEHNLQEIYTKLGINDAKLGRDTKEVKEYIDSDSKSQIRRFLAEIRSRLAIIKNTLSLHNSEFKKNNEKLNLLETDISQNVSMGLFKIIFMFIMPALIYIVGDIMFSKELIVQGWGLGNGNPIETWGLALAIGVAPFFVKYIFEKFINPHLDSESIPLRRFLTGVYIFLGIIMVAAFLQIGYLRGILYKITKLTIEGNIYDTLYAMHPHLMVWSFVIVALMFVIGGGILLSIGSKQLSLWVLERKNLKKIRNTVKENKFYTNELKKILGEEEYIKNLGCANDKIDEESANLSKTLYYFYTTGYATYLKEQEIINNELMDTVGLSEYLRTSLDKQAKNGRMTNGGLS
ncbi:hypothetical protein ACFL5D_05250 [Candidatus Neomarinimicrobiota bacterium]